MKIDEIKSWVGMDKYNTLLSDDEKLYTKTQLKDIFHQKPKKEEEGEWISIHTYHGWKEYEFFTLKQTIDIKKRSQPVIRNLDITPENIAKALYVINKSAKRSRDTKKDNYYLGRHGIVSVAKQRANDLYDIKDRVIRKVVSENLMRLEGYHIQQVNEYETQTILLYKMNDFSFHIPVNDVETKNLKCLGNIEGVISKEMTRKVDIKFNESIDILKRYLKQEWNQFVS